MLEFLVISFPSEVLAWLDRGLRANQLNERRSNALIMVPDLVQTELGLVQRCLPLCMGEAGSCSPQCTPTLLCSSRSAPPKKRKQLETHARLFHQMGQALSLLIACDLGAEFGHADVLIAAQQRLLQQADCGQMYSCYARQQFGAKARHALVFFLFVSVLLMSAYLYINRWQWFAYSVGLYFKKANTGVYIIYIYIYIISTALYYTLLFDIGDVCPPVGLQCPSVQLILAHQEGRLRSRCCCVHGGLGELCACSLCL